MEPIVKDQLHEVDWVCAVTTLSKPSVWRNPELRAMRIRLGGKVVWSEVAVFAWMARLRNDNGGISKSTQTSKPANKETADVA